MKRTQLVWLAVVICLCAASAAHAQMGVNFFKKPNIADIFKPVVGNGSAYEMQRTGKDAKQSLEMSIVGKESVDGKEAYWMEVGHPDEKSGTMAYAKMLITKSDFQFHKMVFQQPGQPAMEMPFHPEQMNMAGKHAESELEKWSLVGTESITVPAGTFSCQHWKKNEGVGDVWVSDKVSPLGMIKSVQPNETMVLTKVITDAKDHITGPVRQFDPMAMRQQMMQQMQKQKP